MKTFLSLLSALLLLVPLCACAAQTDPDAGRYLCVRALYADGEDRPDGAYLTLSGEHRAALCLDGGEEAVQWALEGEDLLLGSADGKKAYRGTLSGGVIEISLDDADCIFVREGVDYTPEPLPEPETQDGEALAEQAMREERAAWWSGDFYGWWFIREASGAYGALSGHWWDLCASAEADADGHAFFTLWDEDDSRADPYGRIEFSLDLAKGSCGKASSVRGFFGPTVFGSGDITVDPDRYPYDDLIVLYGDYSDESGSYRFEAFLRPWGLAWTDVAEVSEDLLPYYYESWYLPRIEAQEPMPDRIGEGAAPRGSDA